MRSAYILGAFAFVMAGSAAVAQAKSLPVHHTQYVATQSAAHVKKAQSPDVALWTAEATATAIAPRDGGHGVRHFANTVLSRTSRIASQLTRSALRFLGTPYVFGGTSSSGFDCSGYTQHVFALLGISIPRTADAQYYAGSKAKGGMRPGDLVFFQTYEPGPSHVGIYLGHDRFVQASSSHGVIVSSLSEPYWAARFIGARRLLKR